MMVHVTDDDTDGKLTILKGWRAFRLWRMVQKFRTPAHPVWVQLKNPHTAQTLPRLSPETLDTTGQVIWLDTCFDIVFVRWASGLECLCYKDDLEVISCVIHTIGEKERRTLSWPQRRSM